MSRLARGLWHVRWRYEDRLLLEPEYPVPYHQAELFLVVPPGGALGGRLVRVPFTRAPWEFVAPFEASDKPRWGEEYQP